MGLTVVGELNGGHQSRVVLAHRDEEQLIIKLTDARLVDLQESRPGSAWSGIWLRSTSTLSARSRSGRR